MSMPQLQAYKIQRTYFKTNKYSLNIFIPPCETTIIQNGYNVNPIGILYLSLPWKDGSTVKRSLDIRMKNKMRILRCINEALSWFNSYNDLYVTQDGVLHFNTNYNNLSAKYRSDVNESPPQAIKIVPIVIESGMNSYEEGVLLYINGVENFIELTKDELQELFDILYNFDFSREIQLSYESIMMSYLTNKIGTQQQNYTARFLK